MGGEFGPYRQSERWHLYQAHLKLLKEKNLAYPCYCSEEELEAKREAALQRGETPRYDRKCLSLTAGEIRSLEAAGRQPAWRLRVPSREIKWDDQVKGQLTFHSEHFGDFVIVRPDGIPLYNFAAAVDDGLMKITHVIRGDDHVSNTPKQILLYEAFGWPLPTFGHIPMILGPDRTRLSKRHGVTSVGELRANGYLPQTLVNFLSLLSWSSESGDELLSRERLIDEFDFNRMSKSPAVFDIIKLNWMNGVYLRAMEIKDLVAAARPFFQNYPIDISDEAKLADAIELVRDNVETLTQLPAAVEPFYRNELKLAAEAREIASRESSQKIYWAFLRALQNCDRLDADAFRAIMQQVQKETGAMGKELWAPMRAALMGKTHGPDLAMAAQVLGKEKSERFVRSLLS
jgi:nondiscriminating glutamyl-tRNA synthetase